MTRQEIRMALKAEYFELQKNPNRIVFDPERVYYNYLVHWNKIPVPHPDREMFMAHAEEIHKVDLREEKKRANTAQGTVVQNWIDNFREVIKYKPVMRAKYYGIVTSLILNDFLKEKCNAGIDFKSWML